MFGRLLQVWHYLVSRRSPEDIRDAAMHLTPAELTIFAAMSPPDQAHASRVARRLRAAGAPRPVVAAGYLHDAGKPAGFNLVWRTFVVLWPGIPPAPDPPAAAPWRRARQIYHWHGHYAAQRLESAASHPELLALVRGDAQGPWVDALRKADDLG